MFFNIFSYHDHSVGVVSKSLEMGLIPRIWNMTNLHFYYRYLNICKISIDLPNLYLVQFDSFEIYV